VISPSLLDEVRRLPFDDRLELADALADSIAADARIVTPEVKQMLDEAITDMEEHPDDAVPLSVLLDDLAKFRR